jgi:hypothetical protein
MILPISRIGSSVFFDAWQEIFAQDREFFGHQGISLDLRQ